ncbi:MAG: FumA C-terminus/TtdB family hydratase beta subunit [Candidatus Micrarchaeia archaeon]
MKIINLNTPISENEIKKLKIGDFIFLNGEIVSARDRAHLYLTQEKRDLPFSLEGGVIYHLGPIVKKEKNEWKIISAGPTTSMREEPYEHDLIKNYGIRIIIGKGGMGGKTLEALRDFKAVYLSAIGGAGAYLSNCIKKVENVYMLEEFGIPEAMWKIRVENFPAIVTMDCHKNSLHEEIRLKSSKILGELIR